MSDHSFLPAWREQSLGRRLFLRVSAASAASVALVATGCAKDPVTPTAPDPYKLLLPAKGTGLLYYAYLMALAQTTVYQKLVDTPPTDFTVADRAIFADLRDHGVVHRETLRYLIDPTLAQQLFPTGFAFSITSFTLTTRAGALTAAQQLADLVAAAYPTLLPLFTALADLAYAEKDIATQTKLVNQRSVLVKVSSVQSRHAAAVRDLLMPGSFANSTAVDASGQLITKTPTEVMATLDPYFAPYVISVVNLPLPV